MMEQFFQRDSNSTVSCDVTWPSPPDVSYPFTIHVELSDPTATAVLARPPDVHGWYTHPVGISFQGSAFSGIASCTSAMTYSGPDTLSTTVNGTCTDNAGKVAGASVAFRYDSTPPTIAGAVASRPPDYNGWYNHPVNFVFNGTDAISGIEDCSTVTYAGPDDGNAQVVGSCRDRAGNVASLAVPLRYQATPPSLAADVDAGDRIVFLHWRASAGVEIVRSPGLGGSRTSVIYEGDAGSFNDARVRDGVRYTYTLTTQDQAGNVTTRTLSLTPGPRLLSPPPNGHLTSPPLLRWTPVRGASYYNVQLFHGGKVLSTWPAHPSLRLKRSWLFGGRRYRLKPGRYLWYVWPGFGARTAARYGPLVGKGAFVVTPSARLSAAPERNEVAQRVWSAPGWVAAFG